MDSLTKSLPIAALLLLTACGGSSPSDRDAAADRKSATSADVVDATMVSAVSSGKPGAAVDLKFDIATRPRVGEPLQVTVAVTTRAADIDKLQVIFQSTDGIQVTDGVQLPTQERPADGQTFSHVVTVLPQKDGVFYLSAVALVESGGDAGSSVARTFAIPIIVGDIVAAEAALQQAAEDTATSGPRGERVQPLPAEESGDR